MNRHRGRPALAEAGAHEGLGSAPGGNGVLAAGLAVAAALVVVAVVGGGVLGYRLLVVEGGTPAVPAGALVVSRPVAPASVRPGQIVTLRDRPDGDDLVTQRVLAVAPAGSAVALTTRGDGNGTRVYWTVPRTGTVGRAVLTVPWVGPVVAVLAHPVLRLVVIWMVAGWLAFLGVRRIWGRPSPAVPGPPIVGWLAALARSVARAWPVALGWLGALRWPPARRRPVSALHRSAGQGRGAGHRRPGHRGAGHRRGRHRRGPVVARQLAVSPSGPTVEPGVVEVPTGEEPSAAAMAASPARPGLDAAVVAAAAAVLSQDGVDAAALRFATAVLSEPVDGVAVGEDPTDGTGPGHGVPPTGPSDAAPGWFVHYRGHPGLVGNAAVGGWVSGAARAS